MLFVLSGGGGEYVPVPTPHAIAQLAYGWVGHPQMRDISIYPANGDKHSFCTTVKLKKYNGVLYDNSQQAIVGFFNDEMHEKNYNKVFWFKKETIFVNNSR